jgi:hypothetical protein
MKMSPGVKKYKRSPQLPDDKDGFAFHQFKKASGLNPLKTKAFKKTSGL